MNLKCGITGFHSAKRLHELPCIEFQHFKRTLAGVMSSIGYTPLEFTPAACTPNFHVGVFGKHKERIAVICNLVYPVVALTLVPDETACELAYVNAPAIENVITQYTEYEVLGKEYLETSFSKEDMGELNPGKISQLKYGRPRTFGEIIFNWWD